MVAIAMDLLEYSVRFCVRLVGEKHQHKHRPTIPILSKWIIY